MTAVDQAGPAGPAGDPGHPGGAPRRRWYALASLALVQFVVVIDTTIVNVALPSVQRDLGLRTSDLAWVVDGYLLTAGGLLLLGGRVSDLLGRRRLFLLGTAVFGLASLACGLAPSPGVLVAGRFVQGSGEAMASPAALSMIALLFPDGRERNTAMGVWGGLSGLGATVGVLLSGVLTDLVGWRWVFFVNLPFVVVALLLVPRLVTESRAERGAGGRVDVLGAVLVTGGLVGVVDGLLAAARHGWGDAAVAVPIAAGVAALVAFVAVEARSADPLVPLRFFAHRTRVSANLASVLLSSGMIAMFLLLTLFMQNVLGYSPMRAGLAYLPMTGAFGAGVLAYTQVSRRAGLRVALVVAFAVGAAGMLLLSRVPADGTYASQILPATLVIGVGFGMALPALPDAALHGVSERDAGLASGVQTTVQALGGALGVSVLVTVALRRVAAEVAAHVPAHEAAVDGYQLAYRVGALVLAAGAVLLALGVRTASTRTAAPPAPSAPAEPAPEAHDAVTDEPRRGGPA